jgi:hypothetical protein
VGLLLAITYVPWRLLILLPLCTNLAIVNDMEETSMKRSSYRGFELVYESQHAQVTVKLDGKRVHTAKNLEAAKQWVSNDPRCY